MHSEMGRYKIPHCIEFNTFDQTETMNAPRGMSPDDLLYPLTPPLIAPLGQRL